MKKFFTMMASVFASVAAFAQAPGLMQYSCVVLDADQNVVADKEVSGVVCIGHELTSLSRVIDVTAKAVFTETFTTTTDANGSMSIVIGQGTAMGGTMQAAAAELAAKADGKMSVVVFIDPAGGTDYSVTGQSYLLSVPYALSAGYAETAKTALNAIGTATSPAVTVSNVSFGKRIYNNTHSGETKINGQLVENGKSINIPRYQKVYIEVQKPNMTTYSLTFEINGEAVKCTFLKEYTDSNNKEWCLYEFGPVIEEEITSISVYVSETIY